MSSVTSTYGANIAFIEELYEKFRANPESVSPSWREFFRGYDPQEEEVEEDKISVPAPAPVAAVSPALQVVPGAIPLRGAAGKIAENMEASLSVPTATSMRT